MPKPEESPANPQISEFDTMPPGEIDQKVLERAMAADEAEENPQPEVTPDKVEKEVETPEAELPAEITPEVDVPKGLPQVKEETPEVHDEKVESDKPEAQEKEVTPKDVDWEKRYKDTQAAFTKRTQELRERERREKELERELELAKAKAQGGNGELTPEEIANMKVDDPDKYAEWYHNQKEYEKTKTHVEASAQSDKLAQQDDVVISYLNDQWGIDVDLQKPFAEQPDNFKKFQEAGNLKKIEGFLQQNMKPGPGGVYTYDQMIAAHRVLFYDQAISQVKVEAREDLVENMDKASRQTSVMDKTPGATGGGKFKELDDLSPDEIDKLNPKQLSFYLERAKSQGVKF